VDVDMHLNDDGLLRKGTLAQNLEVTFLGDVDDGHGVGSFGVGVLDAGLLGDLRRKNCDG
jgi:hypothetical protein